MLLDLKNIEKKYDVPSGKEPVTVLNNISLQVEQGEAIAVVGPSGSGKSTLLNIIGTLDKATSGSVNFDGNNLAEMSENELAHIRNMEIGFIFQLHHLLPQCTVLENVLIPAIPQKMKKNYEELRNRAEKLLGEVGLENHFDYFPAQLSGGEQQRVAVVRALINEPKMILADEPTGSLDQTSANNMGQILIDLNKAENVTLIVVTHSHDLAERMDTVYNLYNGRLEVYLKKV
ncbi:ABC transporter ATP-binding protein [Candidatus Latescibacterota bacterium]